MKKFLLSSILAMLSIIGFAGSAPLVAFPGAEGFGKYAVGGRGGKVVAVTNLNDYKSTETPIEGSLRWALDQYVSTDSVDRVYTAVGGGDSIVKKAVTVFTPLTIVFNISGTIWLKEDLRIKRDSLTIAGQTAPGDGICIAGRSVLFNGATGGEMFYWGPRRRELIVRYLRFRPGIPKDESGTPTSSFVTYGTDVENYENVIFDHCSMSWANEECLAIYDNKNTTVQWCIVSEGLYNAYHPKGIRAYGGVWGGQYATYHHNVIAHNNSRTARFNGARAHDTIAVVEYRNNVIYNWGSSDGAYGGEMYETDTYTDSLGYTRYIPSIKKTLKSSTGNTYYELIGRAETNLINNYYKPGLATSTGSKSYRLILQYDRYETQYPDKEVGQIYADGNYVYGNTTISSNNWNGGIQYKSSQYASLQSLFKLESISSEITPVLPTTLETAEEAFLNVLDYSGANLPLRDAHDKRILNEINTGTTSGTGSFGTNKGIIDDPEVVGGWPNLTTGTVLTDTDGDGMPDDWEDANSLNKNDSTDGNGIATSGYTNLEEYLNGITAPTDFIQAPFFLQGSLNGSQVDLSWQDVADNEDSYEIERSNGVDAFVNIGTIAANSTSFTDSNPLEGTNVYRVRATTNLLQSVYCDTALISTTTDNSETKIDGLSVYPNPVVDQFTIQANDNLTKAEVLSANGNLISAYDLSGTKTTLNLREIPSGLYYIQISSDNGKELTKLIKE